METTRFLGASNLAHSPENWPLWYAANYVFDRSTSSATQAVTSSYSTVKLMLFSQNAQLFSLYMGALAAPGMFFIINRVFG